MTTTAPVRKERLYIEVAADGMTALICAREADRGGVPPEEAILKALGAAEVRIDDDVRRRAAEYARLSPPPDVFVLAEGQPVRHAQNERFVWSDEHEQEWAAWQDDAPVNYYSPNDIHIVREGSTIGRLEPPLPPSDGLTVRGDRVKAEGQPSDLALDATVGRSPEDPRTILAGAYGRVVDDAEMLRIEPVHVVEGNIDHDAGAVDTTTPIHVAGRIVDRTHVRSTRSITVCDAIEAAHVASGEDVIVRRGIIGQRAGLVRAQREIIAKFASEANLVCGGDLKIGRQLMNSNVCVGGRLIAEGANVIGGSVVARDGLIVGGLGSDANVATRVVAGVEPAVVREAAVLARRVERADALIARLRDQVAVIRLSAPSPSGAHQRQISSLERVIDEASHRAAGDQERSEGLLKRVYAAVTPSIRVSGVIHAGVTLRIADRETRFHTAMKGPVSIERRKVKNVTELVAVAGPSGAAKVLKNERRSPEELLDGLDLEEDGSDPSR